MNFMYAEEAYGEGLYTTVANMASIAKQAFRINGIGIKYMPTNYNLTLASVKCKQAKAANSKFIYMGMTIDQSTMLLSVMETEGILYSSKYQIVGSEAAKLGGSTPKPSKPLPVGFLRFNPVNMGPLFPKFRDLWLKLTPADVSGVAAAARYNLDKFKKQLSTF